MVSWQEYKKGGMKGPVMVSSENKLTELRRILKGD